MLLPMAQPWSSKQRMQRAAKKLVLRIMNYILDNDIIDDLHFIFAFSLILRSINFTKVRSMYLDGEVLIL